MRNLIILLVLIVIVACGTLPEDKTPAPIDNNLWTLELKLEDQVEVGLTGLAYTASDLEKKLTVPLFHKGEYSITSKRCLFEKSSSYDVGESGQVTFTVSELLENKPSSEFACIFNIVVFTEGFDKGRQGQFILSENYEFVPVNVAILGRDFFGSGWLQARNTINTDLEVSFMVGSNAGTMFFEGCGRKDEMTFEKDFVIPLSFFTGKVDIKSCVYEIGVLYDNGSTGIFTFNFKTFDSRVLALADPVLEFKNGKLKVDSDIPVAYVSIDDKYKKGFSISKKVGDETAWVRMITANGRFVLLGVKKGKVVWKPFWIL